MKQQVQKSRTALLVNPRQYRQYTQAAGTSNSTTGIACC